MKRMPGESIGEYLERFECEDQELNEKIALARVKHAAEVELLEKIKATKLTSETNKSD